MHKLRGSWPTDPNLDVSWFGQAPWSLERRGRRAASSPGSVAFPSDNDNPKSLAKLLTLQKWVYYTKEATTCTRA
jgi:hypothetical protein